MSEESKGAPKKINPSFIPKRKHRLSVDELVQGIFDGNRSILGRAITIIESNRPNDQEMAQEIIERCLPKSGQSIRIGITGVPGVGKSTFIEALGMHLCENNNKIAVLAIDPSSEKTGGSILGDKTRMEELSSHENAFIRPSPSRGSLGGVAKKTRETVILCEAAGFETILIETVGVGQSEIAVHSMTDFFLLLMLAGAGDELQGIKRGIMEMADAIAITKADGQNLDASKNARMEYKRALHLFPPSKSGWTSVVNILSSVEKTGIEDIWTVIQDYKKFTQENGYFESKRNAQASYWMEESIREQLQDDFYSNETIKKEILQLESEVQNGTKSPFQAANQLIDLYRKLK